MPDLRRKITEAQEMEIVHLAEEYSRAELSYTDIARRFHVSPSTVGAIVRKHRKRKKDVTAAEIERARIALLVAEESE